MIELSIFDPVMTKFTRHLLKKYNQVDTPELITAEIVTRELSPFNGRAELLDIWRIYFDRDEDLTYFMLKWS